MNLLMGTLYDHDDGSAINQGRRGNDQTCFEGLKFGGEVEPLINVNSTSNS